MMRPRWFLSLFGLGVAVIAAAPAADALDKIVMVHAVPRLSASFAIGSSLPTSLGYWKEEGLEVEVNTSPGTSASMQLVMGGKVDVAYGNPLSAMKGVQKGEAVRFFYTSMRGDIFGIALPAGSGLAALADLRGKTVGVSSFGSGGAPYARALLASAGLQAEKDYALVEVGVGARAAAALQTKNVHALSLWDEAYVAMEQGGVKFTTIIKDPRAQSFIAGSLVVQESTLAGRRKALIGLARGMAKAQLFQETNPEAVVRIHWKLYPQTAPREGVTDEAVKKEAKVVAVRNPIQSLNVLGTGRFGDLPPAHMERFQDYLIAVKELERKLDVGRYYTNEMIDEINNFNKPKVVEQARSFKMP